MLHRAFANRFSLIGKKVVLGGFVLALLMVGTGSGFFVKKTEAACSGSTYVSSYFKSNGSYVSGHYRTCPDSSPFNNYSYPGNYNPNTGRISTGSQSSYLNNYYPNGSGSSYNSGYGSTYGSGYGSSYNSGSNSIWGSLRSTISW